MEDGMNEIEVRTAAGTFLAQALGWPGDPAEIGASLDLAQVHGDERVYSAEIETDAGDVAILIFAYGLTETGRERRIEAVQTMLEAAQLGTPGPRVVAEGEVDEFGLILATTPAGLAILTGEAQEESASPKETPGDIASTRAQAADALLDALRAANERAAELQRLLPEQGSGERSVEERALSLFLLDPSSLGALTRVMRRMVEDAAREHVERQPK
jgi:hypothetical protein